MSKPATTSAMSSRGPTRVRALGEAVRLERLRQALVVLVEAAPDHDQMRSRRMVAQPPERRDQVERILHRVVARDHADQRRPRIDAELAAERRLGPGARPETLAVEAVRDHHGLVGGVAQPLMLVGADPRVVDDRPRQAGEPRAETDRGTRQRLLARQIVERVAHVPEHRQRTGERPAADRGGEIAMVHPALQQAGADRAGAAHQAQQRSERGHPARHAEGQDRHAQRLDPRRDHARVHQRKHHRLEATALACAKQAAEHGLRATDVEVGDGVQDPDRGRSATGQGPGQRPGAGAQQGGAHRRPPPAESSI